MTVPSLTPSPVTPSSDASPRSAPPGDPTVALAHRVIRTPGRSLGQIFGRLLCFTALGILLLGVVEALHADPAQLTLTPWQTPGARAWAGGDLLGRDVWVRMVWAVGPTLQLVAWLFAGQLLLGGLMTTIWVRSGATGRQALQQIGDALQLLPRLLVLLVAVAAWRAQPQLAASAALLALGWPWIMQELGQAWTQAWAHEAHQAALSMGASRAWRWRHHLAPALAPVLVSQLGLALVSAVPADASLSLLGFGPPPPTPTWGRMVQDGLSGLTQNPWATLAPTGAMLALVILGHAAMRWATRQLAAPSPGEAS